MIGRRQDLSEKTSILPPFRSTDRSCENLHLKPFGALPMPEVLAQDRLGISACASMQPVTYMYPTTRLCWGKGKRVCNRRGQHIPTGTLGCLIATAKSSASSFCLSSSAFFLSCKCFATILYCYEKMTLVQIKAPRRASTCFKDAGLCPSMGRAETFCSVAADFCFLAASSTVFLTCCTYLHAACACGRLLHKPHHLTRARHENKGQGLTAGPLHSCSYFSDQMSCPLLPTQ